VDVVGIGLLDDGEFPIVDEMRLGGVATSPDCIDILLTYVLLLPSGEINVSGLNFTKCLFGGFKTVVFEPLSKSKCITFPSSLFSTIPPQLPLPLTL
jgi:hypothetical protein